MHVTRLFDHYRQRLGGPEVFGSPGRVALHDTELSVMFCEPPHEPAPGQG